MMTVTSGMSALRMRWVRRSTGLAVAMDRAGTWGTCMGILRRTMATKHLHQGMRRCVGVRFCCIIDIACV